MRKLLVVVDYQNDFCSMALGFEKATTLDEGISRKVQEYVREGNPVIFTMDTHYKCYLDTREGRNLPVKHCIDGTEGWELYNKTKDVFENNIEQFKVVKKDVFGIAPYDALQLMRSLNAYGEKNPIEEVEFVGVVTNMCVISNAVVFQTIFPEATMVVDASLCASFDEPLHEKALDVMESMQMRVINRYDIKQFKETLASIGIETEDKSIVAVLSELSKVFSTLPIKTAETIVKCMSNNNLSFAPMDEKLGD